MVKNDILKNILKITEARAVNILLIEIKYFKNKFFTILKSLWNIWLLKIQNILLKNGIEIKKAKCCTVNIIIISNLTVINHKELKFSWSKNRWIAIPKTE